MARVWTGSAHALAQRGRVLVTKELDPYERWMARSNLARIARGEATVAETVAVLRANGYPRIADAVEREA